VELPEQYPYKSPSIGFINKIFHPNIDELSGSVCLDVINQTWSPMFDMLNIFEQFLPQLLRYPNPSDPLNGEAANMLMREPKAYEEKVKLYVLKYASKYPGDSPKSRIRELPEGESSSSTSNLRGDDNGDAIEEDEDEADEDEEMSSGGSWSDDENDPSKDMDP